ncbi:MAG: LytTR family DNA-binding domain-containing protein [Leptospiraceae bacterium]|nr:LytTR family DNA-binding domain-containing protein [Leptospiraceae bacterium]
MRVLIIEDEMIAAKAIAKILKKLLGSEIKLLHIESTLLGAECYIEEKPIDLVFLDLNLDGREGFEILKKNSASSFHTIIISSWTERAIEAFGYGVIDFIPKPINIERLKQALIRFKTARSSLGKYTKYVGVKKENTIQLIPIKEITFIQAKKNFIELNKKDGTKENHRKTLDSIIKILPDHFVRVHKSYLVNLKFVSTIETKRGGYYSLLLKDNTKIPLSRKVYSELKTRNLSW